MLRLARARTRVRRSGGIRLQAVLRALVEPAGRPLLRLVDLDLCCPRGVCLCLSVFFPNRTTSFQPLGNAVRIGSGWGAVPLYRCLCSPKQAPSCGGMPCSTPAIFVATIARASAPMTKVIQPCVVIYSIHVFRICLVIF